MKTLNVIFGVKLGQKRAGHISSYDITLCHMKIGNIYNGFVLLIGILYNMKIQTLEQHPFLTSKYITSCFKMALLRLLVF